MTYELLFLDMDGTLKEEPYPISQTNKDAIRKACQAGKKISIASGRNRDLILPTVKELRLDETEESYTIALNGAHIIENRSGNTLHTEDISMELTRFLFEKANELKISCHVYTENYIYFNYDDEQFKWYQKEGCDCYLIDLSLTEMGIKEPPLKFFLRNENIDELEHFRVQTLPVTTESLVSEFSSPFSLEFTSKNVSKGFGLEYICKLYELPVAAAIAAGDGENDISMLQRAGLGIAMKNALDTVKAVADTETYRTCQEDGVAEIIMTYLLP